jgi:hypothetical protein
MTKRLSIRAATTEIARSRFVQASVNAICSAEVEFTLSKVGERPDRGRSSSLKFVDSQAVKPLCGQRIEPAILSE